MTVSSFRLAFWSLVVCLGLVTLLAVAGSSAAPAEETVEDEEGFAPTPGLLVPDRRTRARVAALERDAERLESRLRDVRGQLERHDRLHTKDAARLAELDAARQWAIEGLTRRLDSDASKVAALERLCERQRTALDELTTTYEADLAALRSELADVASREPVVPPAEPAMLFVPFPQPVVLHAERTEPVSEPLSVRVEVEAVEVPATPPPPAPPVRPPYCDPCEPHGPHLGWPVLP